MKKIFYSDLANIPPEVCMSSLDENLKPISPSNTAHRWDDTTDPVTCAECGASKTNDDMDHTIVAKEADVCLPCGTTIIEDETKQAHWEDVVACGH